MDRQKHRRGEGAHARPAPEEKTNICVIILQQLSLFSNWWAQAEQKCSIGLAGRFVFSFGAAGEPGLDTDANFGRDVVLPLVKDVFRLVLLNLGSHVPWASDNPMFSWGASKEERKFVRQYPVKCYELTRENPQTETVASCLNKAGYWLSCVSFWNTVLEQVWPHVLGLRTGNAIFEPQMSVRGTKLGMNFFTWRFLFGAAVLSKDMCGATWMRRRRTDPNARMNAAAALLLKASAGTVVDRRIAQRAAPQFKDIEACRETDRRYVQRGTVVGYPHRFCAALACRQLRLGACVARSSS